MYASEQSCKFYVENAIRQLNFAEKVAQPGTWHIVQIKQAKQILEKTVNNFVG